MRHVPWHVKGIRPEARDLALDAARRSGLSVGEWLNSLIIEAQEDAAPRDGAAPARRDIGPRQGDREEDGRFAAIGKAIEELQRRIEDLSADGDERTAPLPRGEATPDRLVDTDATARIESRPESQRRDSEPSRKSEPPLKQLSGVDEAFAEITARQRALDAADAGVSDPPGRRETSPSIDPAKIEQQLRAITDEIKGLRGSCRAEGMARSLENAAPRHVIEAMEKELGRLASRIEAAPAAPPVAPNVDSLRQDLGDISRRLNDALSQRDPAPIEDGIRALSDQIAKLDPAPRAEDIADILRSDLTEIRAALQHATQFQDAAAIKEQVRTLTQEVAKLNAPLRAEDVAEALRRDLAEVGAALRSAMPTSALAALEQEVRTLNARIEASRALQPGSPFVADLEQALAEIRDRLRVMTPAEDLGGLNETVKELSRKADMIAAERPTPDLLRQLEQAIAALHELTAQVASQDAVAALSRDIRGLSEQIDHGARQAADAEFMSSIDRRLAEMNDVLGRGRPAEAPAIPAELDLIIKRLADRLEAIQVPAFDAAALKGIEQRIVVLGEKIDASQTGLGRLDSVERGLDELVMQLRELATQNERKLQVIQHQLVTGTVEAIGAPAEAIRRDVATLKEIQSSADRRTQDTFEAVYGTIEQVVDRLATIEQTLREGEDGRYRPVARDAGGASGLGLEDTPSLVPEASTIRDRNPTDDFQASAARQSRLDFDTAAEPSGVRSGLASAGDHHPASELPPDAPLEPGSGARRVRIVANAIDRIAASEAANAGSGAAKPLDPRPSARAGFVAAARRAAKAAADERSEPASELDERTTGPKGQSRLGALMRRISPRIKPIVLGISLILLMLGALRLSFDLIYNPGAPTWLQPKANDEPPAAPAANDPGSPADGSRPGKGAALFDPGLSSRHATLLPGEAALGPGAINDFNIAGREIDSVPSGQQTSAPITAIAAPAAPDTTGSLTRAISPGAPQGRDANALAPETTAAPEMAHDLAKDALPVTIGSKALIVAAGSGDAGASYEVASRYAEGRNVPQDLPTAALWFERAARSGLAPAQFRLGSMYEKGLGLKKDLQEARRLYLAAADRGNAKAMHNLAVLYAEGIDGRPDYAAATQWFRKAAGYGLIDSEYNLAILYARGVGIERNLPESYKWFALAAKGGDGDAGQKRDDIAGRLDPQQLARAKQEADAFVPDRQPQEATATKAPPGGWDEAAPPPPVSAPPQVTTPSKPRIARQRAG